MHLKHTIIQTGILLALILGLVSGSLIAAAQEKEATPPPPIIWQDWNKDIFQKSKSQNRYVLLDLYAKWCHWCHFMEQRTYASEPVRALVDKGYLAVKADQDAHPDLASRYGDWGWPATIIFDPKGNEVAKLRGFQRPSLMAHILNTIREHPERVPKLLAEKDISRSNRTYISLDQRKTILALLDKTYDKEFAGWGKRLKFLQPDVIEYAMKKAHNGDEISRRRVIASLDAATALLDREWGGIFQYSHKRDWSAPHYEKIMWYQAQLMRLYARASVQFKKPEYLEVAQQIHRYLKDHLLSANGAFYTSQDADVDEKMLGKEFYALDASQRARLGTAPLVDQNIYARENGWAISGLLGLYAVSGDKSLLQQSITSAKWVLSNRSLPQGGFRHGDKDSSGPFLSDTLAMGTAMLDLYMASGDHKWLKKAALAADYIEAGFQHPVAGYKTTNSKTANGGAFNKPYLNIEENSRLARFATLLYRTGGKERFKHMAERAMRYLTNDSVTGKRRFLAGLLLANDELSIEPAHITIVGSKKDTRSAILHQAALKLPLSNRRIDWWDPREGPMANQDITYPLTDQPAAYACANQVCSLPVFKASDLTKTVARMMRIRRPAPQAQLDVK